MEKKQSEIVEEFVQRATSIDGAASLAALILEATSHPSLFAFSEILAVPNIAKLDGTQYSSSLDLLRLFAYGTWNEYIRNTALFPKLLPDQVLKLKQLSVLSLVETEKVLSYDKVMQEIDVSNVRELEDFIIECMYAGIVRGKLDQLRRCFEVQFATGRDLLPEQLSNMIHTLNTWLGTSDSLLEQIQEKIKWADVMSEAHKNHCKEVEDRIEEVKKTVKVDLDFRGHEELYSDSVGLMDFEEDRTRPKRRRHPMH